MPLALTALVLGSFVLRTRQFADYTVDDAYIARLPGGFNEKLDPDYVFDRRPTWIVLDAARPHPEPFHGRIAPSQAIHDSPRLAAGYAFWRTYRFDDGYWLWVYRAKSLTPGS